MSCCFFLRQKSSSQGRSFSPRKKYNNPAQGFPFQSGLGSCGVKSCGLRVERFRVKRLRVVSFSFKSRSRNLVIPTQEDTSDSELAKQSHFCAFRVFREKKSFHSQFPAILSFRRRRTRAIANWLSNLVKNFKFYLQNYPILKLTTNNRQPTTKKKLNYFY